MSFDGRDIVNTEFDAAPIVTLPRSDADSQRTSVSPLTGQLSMASAAAARITVSDRSERMRRDQRVGRGCSLPTPSGQNGAATNRRQDHTNKRPGSLAGADADGDSDPG